VRLSLKSAGVGTLVLALVVLLPGCKKFQRKHIPVESLPELAYPSCDGSSQGSVELANQHLRSGPAHPDKSIVERFTIARKDCLTVFSGRQEWPLGTTDIEVVYDAALNPLRIWKRMTVPSLPDPGAKAELRRYELRTEPVGIKRRAPGGSINFEQLKGGHPLAIVGPGRGLISIWLQRAKLQQGQKTRHLVIDVRALEKIEDVTLMREPDMNHPDLGKVRVYTFYGRETVFANEQDVVIGDLAGLRPAASVKLPAPPAIPLFGAIDPIHTP
jgi:hypothetical protein